MPVSNNSKMISTINPIKTKVEMNKIATAAKSVEIENAGIVIMHPFLKNIFKATGLMYFDDFKDDNCKQKAVLLLQYLANGEQYIPGYNSPLNKILCGLDVEDISETVIQLEEAKTKEADELLEAVITHWTTLQNSSAAMLQQTFFQRKGKLSFDDNEGCWKLQVQREAVDILLDKIPWSIAYIQLPWMKHPLLTEW